MLQRATHRPAVIVTTQEVTANVTDDHALGDETTVLAGGGEMGVLMRGVDWSKTSMGPVEHWPQSLRSVVGMLLPSRAQIILFWGPDFTVLYNDSYRPVFGAKHPAALGRPGREAWSEIWDGMLHDLLAGVMRTGEAFWATDLLFLLERHGFVEETYFDVSYDPVRVESGEVGGVYCIVSETTERVVAARRMALLKDLAAPPALATTTRDACLMAMNTLSNHPDDIVFALAYLDGVLACGTPDAERRRANAAAAQVRDLAISSNLSGPAGRLVVGLNPRRPFDDAYQAFLDLVAHQLGTAIASAHAFEQEKKRAEALAELDRAKTMFFSNISHEFRTPLTLITGPVEDMLAESMARPADHERLTLVHRNSLRLLRLVNTLLDFSRLEAGGIRASFEPTDLAALTADLTSTFRSAIERAGMELRVGCEPLREPVYVDRDMWERIVLNLLSNAFKYTMEGSIVVSVRQDGDMAIVAVADTGVGIPAAELPHVFERFHRIAGTPGRTHEGTGIGLAFVKELVGLHGGEVRVDSVAGRGTTFSISLPLGTRHLPLKRISDARHHTSSSLGASPYVEEALRWLPDRMAELDSGDLTSALVLSPAPGRPHAPGNITGARILVADDNADMRDYVARLLGTQYDVELVRDGAAALAAARRRRPDLIVADVMMPVLDGVGLLRALRADAALCTVPVLLLSARAGEEARVEGWEAGADYYLAKPFSARELVARVGTHLEMARVRHDAAQALRQSEERCRAFTRATHDVVFCMNADWSELRYLQGRLFVADTLEPSRNWLQTYIPADDHAHVQAWIDQAVQHRSVFELEHRVLRVDGTEGWISSRAIPIADAAGTIIEWFGAATDVTQRKLDEQRLRADLDAMTRLQRLGWLIVGHDELEPVLGEIVDAAMAIAGADFGNIQLIDPASGRLRIAAQRGFDKWWLEYWDEVGAGLGCCSVALDRGERVIVEDVTASPMFAGPALDIQLRANVRAVQSTPLIGRSGRPLGMFSTHYRTRHRPDDRSLRLLDLLARQAADIIERALGDAALRASEEKLREADRRKDEFLATLAHELRNPLAPIRTGLELIRLGGSTPASVDRVRGIMERQIGHMVRLIDDLLDISRITSGKIQLQRQPVPLTELVAGAVEATRAFITSRQIALAVHLPQELCVLDVDRTRFVQVLSNLLHNAAKFTAPEGRIDLTATMHDDESRAGRELRLTVADSGMGISEQLLPRVFDLFTQGSCGPGYTEAGLGIGLALVRRLVEMHGGHVTATSEGRDRGTQITIRLPACHAAPAGLPHDSSREPAQIACRVLVVDDNEDAAATLSMLVANLGGESRTAIDGPGALRCLTEFEPAVVLLDIGMPGMDGYETCRRMRQTPCGARATIIALTGWGQEDDKQRALAAGFDRHLTKPADPVVVAELLTSAVCRTAMDRVS